jgi:hypothetical protein
MDTQIETPITTITRIIPATIDPAALMFAEWKAQMAARWPPLQPDRIKWLNTRELFVSKGGENGVFLRITPSGYVELGFYMDAWGSEVTSGMFMVNQEAQYPSHTEAIEALCALGLRPTLDCVPSYMLR